MAQGSDRRSSHLEEPRSQYWRTQSEAWSSSGLTQAAFCGERSLSLAAFRWWRWKLKREGSANGASTAPREARDQAMRLVPVRVVDSPSRTGLSSPPSADAGSSFEVLLASGTTVRVPKDFDAAALSRLLCTLEAVGC
jgi:hypothetical protein